LSCAPPAPGSASLRFTGHDYFRSVNFRLKRLLFFLLKRLLFFKRLFFKFTTVFTRYGCACLRCIPGFGLCKFRRLLSLGGAISINLCFDLIVAACAALTSPAERGSSLPTVLRYAFSLP